MTSPTTRAIDAWRADLVSSLDDPDRHADHLLDAVAAHDDGATWISRADAAVVRTRVRAAADAVRDGRSGALAGVPYAVKDNIDVAGLPTTAGCPAFSRVPDASSPVVARLDAAGAICLGKTNLDQFATGLVGTRSPYGTPRNPLDPLLIPGGSSSGSAVAVATGAVAFALGTDTAGSGRVPAAMTGIVGLKPRPGVLPSAGVIPAVASLDCVSVFAATVADADEVLAVLAGAGWGTSSGPMRVAVPDERSLAPLDARTRQAWDQTIELLAGLGIELRVVDLAPFFAVGDLLYGGPWVAERDVAVGAFIDAHLDDVDPVVRATVLASRSWSAADAYRARAELASLALSCAPTWVDAEVLAVPTIAWPPTIVEVDDDPVGVHAQLGRYTNFANLLGLAALSVPGTRRSDGMPVGVSLLCPTGREPALVAVAEHLERDRGVLPAAAGLAPRPGEHLLAVVGAHQSGLALNDLLTDRGATLVARIRTAPAYRLWALTHLEPPRPALERVNDGGAAIEAEVWSMHAAALGAVVAEVAAPLAVGSVELDGGQRVTGFVCEPAGLDDAIDISALGGWRSFLSRRDAVA